MNYSGRLWLTGVVVTMVVIGGVTSAQAKWGPTAFQSSVPAESSAMVASLRHIKLGNVGELSGHVYSHGRPVSGWHVVVGHKLVHHVVAKEKTYSGGIFGFRLPVGIYEVAAKRPSGQLCGKQIAHIKYHKETEIVLNC